MVSLEVGGEQVLRHFVLCKQDQAISTQSSSIISGTYQMSASHSAEELQKLLQGILKVLPLKRSAKRCSDPTTRGRFCDPCVQLKAVDAMLYAHFEEINKLLKTRTELEERVNQHHDPLTRLPVEISSHIFAIYTEDLNSTFDPRNPIVEHGPLLLGAVSKSWRRVAFSTPHLWNTVNIRILSNDNLPMKVGLAKEWLDRSRQLPLHLSVVHEDSNKVKSKLFPLFKVLQNVSPRWCTLVLGISASLYPTFLGDVTCAPTLETLKLIDNSDGQGRFRLPHTPLLKHLDIQVSIPFSDISIDWSSLTTVEANYITIDEYFDVLRLSEALEHFRLRGLVGNARYPLPTTPLTNSTLRELYLETTYEHIIHHSELVTMLNLAVFPSLEKFGYDSLIRTSFPNSAIPSIFNRSRCQLTHFDLCGDLRDGTTDDLISILSDLPTITHFRLEDTWSSQDGAIMSDQLLQMLTPIRPSEFPHTDKLLPRLESMDFRGYKGFSWGCLAGLVSAATSDGGSNLRTTPERQECTNSIRHISFEVYAGKEMERIDVQSLARLQSAHRAGIFRCQVFRGDFGGRVIDPFSCEYDLS